jgi:hypothetical protein
LRQIKEEAAHRREMMLLRAVPTWERAQQRAV